jgi:hypothetical protein
MDYQFGSYVPREMRMNNLYFTGRCTLCEIRTNIHVFY